MPSSRDDKMTRMEISGSGSGSNVTWIWREWDTWGGRVTVPLPHCYCVSHYWGDKSKREQITVIVSAIVLVFIFLYFVSEFSSHHSATAPSASLVYGSSVLGSDLRYMVHKTFAAADKDGSLVSSNVSFSPEVVNDNGIEFLVMTLHDRTFKSRSSNNPDPFDRSALNPLHVVTPISPMHTLILNKFYTIKDHTIVITNSFERQESLLSQYDFEAWFFCVSSIKAIGFYNSNAIAGASQAHKHMQLIPLNEIRNLSPDATYTLPVDIVIRTKIVTKEWNFFLPFGTTNGYLNGLHGNFHQGSAIPEEYLDASQSNFYQIPQYHFKHAVVALIEAEDWAEISDKISYSEYLVATYRWLLTEVNLLPSITSKAAIAYGSYNLLLTDRWMMVVCRQRESLRVTGDDFNDIDVTSINGLGFSGMLLARGPTALSIIKDMTPLSVLQAVSLPLVSD